MVLMWFIAASYLILFGCDVGHTVILSSSSFVHKLATMASEPSASRCVKKGVKSERAFLGKLQHTFSSSPSAKAYSVITSHVSQARGFDGIIISLIFLFFL